MLTNKLKGCSRPSKYLLFKIGLLTAVSIVIWCVMALPTLFYFIRIPQNATAQSDVMLGNLSQLFLIRVCSERFYSDSGICKPECGSWRGLPDSTIKALNIVGIFLTSLNLLLAVVSCILAVIQRKKMLKFPQVIVVYIVITSIVIEVFIFIAYTGGDRLFCPSKDYLEAIFSPTKFCKAAGAIVLYVTLQLEIWWIFQVGMLFWRLMFPFKAIFWERQGKFKYIHITMVLLGVLLPCIPTISVPIVDGFRGVDYLPQFCGPKGSEVSYFTLLLPSSIVQAIGVTLLWILTWNVIEERSKKRKDNKHHDQSRTVEVKISIVLCYHMLLAAMLFIAFGVLLTKDEQYFQELRNYFVCEAYGQYPGKEKCDRSRLDNFAFPILFNILLFLFISYPSFSLVYIVSWTDIRKLCKRLHLKYSTNSTLAEPIAIKLEKIPQV